MPPGHNRIHVALPSELYTSLVEWLERQGLILLADDEPGTYRTYRVGPSAAFPGDPTAADTRTCEG